MDRAAAGDHDQIGAELRAELIARLMLVLCGERDTQRMVNTGTLYR